MLIILSLLALSGGISRPVHASFGHNSQLQFYIEPDPYVVWNGSQWMIRFNLSNIVGWFDSSCIVAFSCGPGVIMHFPAILTVTTDVNNSGRVRANVSNCIHGNNGTFWFDVSQLGTAQAVR